MDIAFDAASAREGTTSISSLTYAHTVGTGNNRILLVGIRNDDNNISSVTYNGVAMTKYVEQTSGPWPVFIYGLLSPSSGAHNVVITCSGSTVIFSQATSYTNVKDGQPDATTTHQSNSETSLTMTLTTVADNCWLVGWAMNDSGNFVAGANTTFRGGTSGIGILDTNAAQTPAGSYSMSLNIGGGGMADSGVMISLSPMVETTNYLKDYRARGRG